MIEKIPFGRTGHASTRIIFGAAALGAMSQARADRTLALIDDYGINHLDTAASYGDSELRLAPLLATRRNDYFLATKTGQRSKAGAAAELRRSLERLGVDHVDLIQLHNLVDPQAWRTAMGEGGALEALLEARDEGLVRHIGVTGHGTYVAERHLQSLEAFDFASVLVPMNYSMLAQPAYAADFERLYRVCQERQVAFQTIKAVAQRRWADSDTAKRYSWYKPLAPGDALRRAVHFVLARPGTFLNTTSDATLLPAVLAAASEPIDPPDIADLQRDVAEQDIAPLFVRDQYDDVRV